MAQVYFRVDGLTKKNFRRWKNFTRTSGLPASIAVSATVVAAVIYAVGSLTPAALVNGKVIRGKNVLVIVDESGSMRGTEDQMKLQSHLGRLKGSGMLLKRRSALGFGISIAAHGRNLLNQIQQGLRANLEVDTVYAFSDFEVVNKSYWKSDISGYQRLGELLRERGIRLYIGTVKDQPSKELVKIVKRSGGDIIERR